MSKQQDITWQMRKTLILWLVQVAAEFNLVQDTLYLTINLIDRVASKLQICQAKYQLLGLTCLWIASKSEENHGRVPTISKLKHMCCYTYHEREFIAMEKLVLFQLGFYLGHVSPEQFLCIFYELEQPRLGPIVLNLSRYLIELSLVHRKFVGALPSTIARASLNLAHVILIQDNSYWHGDPTIVCWMRNLADCIKTQPLEIAKKV